MIQSRALALALKTPNKVGYIPMFVSVKSRDGFTEGAAKLECHAMLQKTKAAKDCTGNETEARLSDVPFLQQLYKGECVARVFRIPRENRFGLCDVFAAMTSFSRGTCIALFCWLRRCETDQNEEEE